MDLDTLKDRFRHKRKADLSEIDIALDAVPFLVREVEKLESDLKTCKSRINQLTTLLNRRPPLTKKGKKGQGEWEVRVDEDKNRLYLTLSGFFDYQSAKVASSSILMTVGNLREDADAINDLTGLKGFDNRALFHLKKIVYTLEYIGVRRVVRILNPETDLTKLLKTIYSQEADYQMSLAKTVKEAETILDNSRQFLKT